MDVPPIPTRAAGDTDPAECRCVSQSVSAPHRRGARRTGAAGQRGRRPARRRRDRAVHRPLPQGGDRDARRRAAAHARGAAALPARAGGAPRGDPRVDPRRRASSTTRSRRRSWPPTPRPGWRTSTCRTSRSGGPRRRSPARPASSRSPTAARRPVASTRRPRRRRSSTPTRASPTPPAALDGARAILVERFAEDADLIGDAARADVGARPAGSRKVRDGKEEAGAKFADYFDFAEPFTKLPSHRILAHVPRREGGGPRPHPRARSEADGAGLSRLRAASPPRFGVADRGRPGRPVAARHRPLGLAHPDPRPPRHRPADAAVAGGRGRGGAGVRGQPARPAARRAGRHPRRRWASTPASAPA